MYKVRASVTIFMLMTILMVAALAFTLIEGTRYVAINNISQGYSDIAVESAFSYYVRPLWNLYGILGIDAGYGSSAMDLVRLEDDIAEIVEENSMEIKNDGYINLLSPGNMNVNTTSYSLLTDNDGAAFIKEASETVLYSDLSKLQSIDGMEDLLKDVDVDKILESGTNALTETEAASTEMQEDTGSLTEVQAIEVEENPIDTVSEWKSKGILAQVINVDTDLSNKTYDTSGSLLVRNVKTGTGTQAEASLVEKALFRKYLIENLQSYPKSLGHDALDYELEYVISGKSSDAQNLEAAVEKLVAVRVVENYIAILQDSAKVQLAEGIAAGLSSVALSPELTEIVEYAVIAAWAYVESILDVRLLLAGGKVPMIKNSSEWTSDPTQLAAYLNVNVKAKDCNSGLTYQEYLYQLLLLTSDRTAAYRAMDVIENQIRKTSNYENFCIDNVIYEGSWECSYEVKPLFLSFTPVRSQAGSLKLLKKSDMSYI